MSIEVNPEEDFHVVVNGNVLALSLDALSAAYEGDVIKEESLIWQPGLGEWMRLDTVLYHLEQQEPDEAPAPEPELDSDTYYVQVAEDEVKQMSLDQLDTAYRVDIIDLSTLVWQPGYTEWVPLSVLLGDEPMDHFSVAPSIPAPAPAPSFAPSAVAPAPAFASAPPPSVAPAPSFASAPPPSVAPAPSFVPQPIASAPSFAPASSPSAAPNSLSAVSSSFIPEIPAPAPKASPWYGRALIAAAALSTLGIAHRHGASYELAASLDGDSPQKTWAARVGEPSTNTPYGLERWLGQVEEKYGLNELSETKPIGAEPELDKQAASEATPTEKTDDSDASSETQVSAAKAEKSPTKEPSNKAANAFGAALSNKPAPAARKAAPARSYKPSPKQKSGGPVKGGHAYDPMNGAL